MVLFQMITLIFQRFIDLGGDVLNRFDIPSFRAFDDNV